MSDFMILTPALRILLYVLMSFECALILLAAILSLFSKQKKILVIYYISLFVDTIIKIATRTPTPMKQNQVVALVASYFVVVPIILSAFLVFKEKKLYIIDTLVLIFELNFFKFVPNWYYIVSFMELYYLIRFAMILSLEFDYFKNNPGLYYIKYALDDLDNGVLFANRFGRVTYINYSMKNFLDINKISSYQTASKIIESIKEISNKSGRYISDNCVVISNDNTSYKFEWMNDNLMWQIIFSDVTSEETATRNILAKQEELKNANKVLNDLLIDVKEIEKAKELLRIKGAIHDSFAQKLSIIHMLLVKSEKIDVNEIKKQLAEFDDFSFDKTINESFSSIEELVDSFKILDININVSGKMSSDEALNQKLISILRECITNAIRHGKSKDISISFSTTEKENKVLISNDGIIPKSFVEGNGLRNIRRIISELGGNINLKTDETFDVEIIVPAK